MLPLLSRALGTTEGRGPPLSISQLLSQVAPHVANSAHSPTTMTKMKNIPQALILAFKNLTDENYEQTLDYFRFWLGIGQAYCHVPPDLLFDVIYGIGTAVTGGGDSRRLANHPNDLRTLRFVSDVESDPVLAPHSVGLRDRFCTSLLQAFFDINLAVARSPNAYCDHLYSAASFVAHCTNLGCMEEDTIRDHILQSIISHQTLQDPHTVALAILFKIAGATFEAYVDPVIVSDCFRYLETFRSSDKIKVALVQVSTVSVQELWN